MRRDLQALANRTFDLVVLGGGIQGACVAWEATLRGLSVALIDRADFGGATSANSLKIIHGGLRYLQTADIRRMRQSIRERQILMAIAPHLVHPLPILVPTYGHGPKGREALFVALKLNDLISCDRNRALRDPQKHIPPGQMLSRQRCQELVPGIADQGLTGAARFHDAQVYNSERLTLAFIKSAAQAGATVANYVEAKGFLQTTQETIHGVVAQDNITGESFDIRARAVINTSGPWLNQVLGLLPNALAHQPFAKAVNVVLRKPLLETTHAVAFRSSTNDHRQKSRMLFVVPWRGTSMVGTIYSRCDAPPDQWQVEEREIKSLLGQINQAYPPAQLRRADVAFVHGGRLPQAGIGDNGEPSLTKQYYIRDHGQDGYGGLLSVTGVKYTTSRDIAQKTVDCLFKRWGQTAPASQSATTPLVGSAINTVEQTVQQWLKASLAQGGPPQHRLKELVYNYGSEYGDVLADGTIGDNAAAILTAQVRYGVTAEMAQTLSDVVLRRTDLGSARPPEPADIRLCAQVMAKALGWSHSRTESEIQALYGQMAIPQKDCVPI